MLKLRDPKLKLGTQWFLDQKDESRTTETFLRKDGFAWRIPRGQNIECGFFGESTERGKDMLGALIPVPGFPLIDAGLIFSNEDNIALCGDAMGLTKPWSGGGIFGRYFPYIIPKKIKYDNDFSVAFTSKK